MRRLIVAPLLGDAVLITCTCDHALGPSRPPLARARLRLGRVAIIGKQNVGCHWPIRRRSIKRGWVSKYRFSLFTAYQFNPRYVPESKLLKSGKSYVIGRKSTCDLVVNHKKVSHDHGKFIVEGFSHDDVVRTPVSPISWPCSLICGYRRTLITSQHCGSLTPKIRRCVYGVKELLTV